MKEQQLPLTHALGFAREPFDKKEVYRILCKLVTARIA